jgi:hypothetical protein
MKIEVPLFVAEAAVAPKDMANKFLTAARKLGLDVDESSVRVDTIKSASTRRGVKPVRGGRTQTVPRTIHAIVNGDFGPLHKYVHVQADIRDDDILNTPFNKVLYLVASKSKASTAKATSALGILKTAAGARKIIESIKKDSAQHAVRKNPSVRKTQKDLMAHMLSIVGEYDHLSIRRLWGKEGIVAIHGVKPDGNKKTAIPTPVAPFIFYYVGADDKGAPAVKILVKRRGKNPMTSNSDALMKQDFITVTEAIAALEQAVSKS